MNQQKMRVGVKSVMYHGDTCLGEVEVFPVKNSNNNNHLLNRPHLRFPNNEIRISYLSPATDRCLPHSVLQAFAPFSVRCKIQATSSDKTSPLQTLYLTCFTERRTAVVVLGHEELHMVALPSRVESFPCFWCFSAPIRLFAPCLGMLNLRCLAIVFDLDETLIVANTMKSFEDRIEALSIRIDAEDDPLRVSGMSAELKRYLEDKVLLKQYIETNTVNDVNGRLITFQNEEVRPLTTSHIPIVRPVIRLQDKNIILTRINPEIRDTSVLVRLRPAWEDLRSYLIAKGRRRFEVYVCTMAEKDYALEMWRLLDPEAHLISPTQLLDRVVCVKSGSKKSLENVFQMGTCHPKFSMVIDDRLNVWDINDQQRVHVVPPFQPYYSPHAETANVVPVLCVARNVACNVRGAFFKEFDDNLLRKCFNLHYEDELSDLPFPPDTSDYLVIEDTCIVNENGNKDITIPDGINGVETEKKPISFKPKVPVAGQENNTEEAEILQMDSSLADDEMHKDQMSNCHMNLNTGDGSAKPSLPIAVLHEIGRICDSKVEFKHVSQNANDLLFSVEVMFGNENVGVGMGGTKNEAQCNAADNALHKLSYHYMEFVRSNNGLTGPDLDKLHPEKDNGFLYDDSDDYASNVTKGDHLVVSTREDIPKLDDSQQLGTAISEIKDLLCSNEDVNLVFREQPPSSIILIKGEYYSQVEVNDRVLGKGISVSKEGAKLLAAEDALKSLMVLGDHQQQNHLLSSWNSQIGAKRSWDQVAGQKS